MVAHRALAFGAMRRRRHTVTLRAFGVNIKINASDERLLAAIKTRALPPSWEPIDSVDVDVSFALDGVLGDLCDLSRDGEPIAQGADLEISLSILDSSLRSELAVRAVGRVFVHAGVVRFGERAMLLPGESFSGKSTLVAALVTNGATYMSDEFAVLSADGMVHPYPRDLSLRIEGLEPGRTTETEPSRLGKVEPNRPAEVGFIVSMRYRPNGSWRPQSRSSGEGALALLAHAAAARERPAEVLTAVRAAATGTIVLEGERGDATDAAMALIAIAGDARGVATTPANG